jgi:uncharacterized protein YutE (UPF0331/DUF86 family)
MNDTVALKVTSLQRCVARARSTYHSAGAQFRTNYDLQDAVVLNILRACETAIDLANMLIRSRKLGIPTDNREAFSILQREGLLGETLAQRMKAMVGFRNLAVHQYRELNMDIVEHILNQELDNLLTFAEQMRTAIQPGS